MAAITCVEANTCAASQGCSPYPDVTVFNTHTHAVCAMWFWGPRYDRPPGKRRGNANTVIFTALICKTHKSHSSKGANFCCSVFSHTHGEDIEELCSALMHWLWSYVMCLSQQWREIPVHANISGAQCPHSTLETIHTEILTWGLFILSNNAWIISPFQTLLFQCALPVGKHQCHRVNQALKYLS